MAASRHLWRGTLSERRPKSGRSAAARDSRDGGGAPAPDRHRGSHRQQHRRAICRVSAAFPSDGREDRPRPRVLPRAVAIVFRPDALARPPPVGRDVHSAGKSLFFGLLLASQSVVDRGVPVAPRARWITGQRRWRR